MPTSESGYTIQEIVRRGKERYEREVRALVEPQHKGKFLALDIETGAFEIDAHALPAADRLRAKHPQAVLFILRVGYPAAYRLGGRFMGVRS
jgi:hypothetical protein